MRDSNGHDGHDHALARGAAALERIALVLWAVAIAAAIGLVIAALGDVVMILFAAMLFAVLLRGGAEAIGRWTRVGPGAGLAIEVLGLLGLFGGFGWWRGPRLVHETGQLEAGMGKQLAALRETLEHSSWGPGLLQHLPIGGGPGANREMMSHLAGMAAGAVLPALGAIGTIGVILVAALYIAGAPRPYIHGLALLLPKRRRPAAHRVAQHVAAVLRGWLLAQVIDMVIVGTLCGVGDDLLGMPLALILGVIAGLLDFIPYVGAFVGAIPAVLIALSISFDKAIVVGMLYLGVQLFQGNVSAPLLQRKTIDLPPALTILSQTFMGVVFGVFGIILATPFTAAVVAVIQAVTAESPDYR